MNFAIFLVLCLAFTILSNGDGLTIGPAIWIPVALLAAIIFFSKNRGAIERLLTVIKAKKKGDHVHGLIISKQPSVRRGIDTIRVVIVHKNCMTQIVDVDVPTNWQYHIGDYVNVLIYKEYSRIVGCISENKIPDYIKSVLDREYHKR